MNDLKRALDGEILKLKRSRVFVTVVGLPSFVITMIVFFVPLVLPKTAPDVKNWLDLTVLMVQFWGGLLIFVVPIVTAMLAALEHQNQMWKMLYALALPRQAVIGAKMMVAIGVFGISYLTLVVSLVVAGVLIGILKPNVMPLESSPPLLDMIGIALMSYVAAWLMITIQMWAALHWKRFGMPLSLGLIALLMVFFIGGIGRLGRIYPWLLPVNFIGESSTDWIIEHYAVTSMLLGVFGAMAVTLLSAGYLARRDVI